MLIKEYLETIDIYTLETSPSKIIAILTDLENRYKDYKKLLIQLEYSCDFFDHKNLSLYGYREETIVEQKKRLEKVAKTKKRMEINSQKEKEKQKQKDLNLLRKLANKYNITFTTIAGNVIDL